MGTAFGLQCLSGLIIAQWPADGGHYPAQAHEAALAAGLGLQLIALAVFLAPKRQTAADARWLTLSPGRWASIRPSLTSMPARYRAALSAWRRHVAHTRRQATAWRFAAVASMALCVGLAGALSLALIRPAVALHVVQGNAPSTHVVRRRFES